MKRGDIYTAATGSGYGSKPRPVLLIQSDLYDELPTILVAIFNSPVGEPLQMRPRIRPSELNGLDHESDLSIDHLVAVRTHKFGQYVGRLSRDDQIRVDRALLLVLGLAE